MTTDLKCPRCGRDGHLPAECDVPVLPDDRVLASTPLPSYGIWTTDENGQRVMGFTPEQFLSVWQARADLEAENKRLREALNGANEIVKQTLEARAVLKDTK